MDDNVSALLTNEWNWIGFFISDNWEEEWAVDGLSLTSCIKCMYKWTAYFAQVGGGGDERGSKTNGEILQLSTLLGHMELETCTTDLHVHASNY